MKNLAHFFSVVEMTKQVPRYGWTTVGLAHEEIDTLAEHHFMVAMMTFLLTADMEMRGMKIDVRRAITMALVHDLGEVFGGDIATPLGLVNPEIKQAARIIEGEAINFLGQMLKNESLRKQFQALCDEEREQKTDEAKVVKMVDRLEAELYKETRYRPVRYTAQNRKYIEKSVFSIPKTIQNSKIQTYCTDFAHTLIDAAHKKELRNAPRERLMNPNKKASQMRRMADLCAILEISKEMPRYGWSFARFSQIQMDKIAEHNYLLAVMNLFLGLSIEEAGLQIDTRKTVEMALVHDLGKLFGGDLSAPWRQAKPKIDEAAKDIKKTAITLLGKITGNQKLQELLERTYQETSEHTTNEALLVRIVGQLEDYLYRELIKQPEYGQRDKNYIETNIYTLVHQFPDQRLQTFMQIFIDSMVEVIHSGNLRRSPLAMQEE